jgi:hypothetical protein
MHCATGGRLTAKFQAASRSAAAPARIRLSEYLVRDWIDGAVFSDRVFVLRWFASDPSARGRRVRHAIA